MRSLAFTGLVLASLVAGGVSGVMRADLAVAAAMSLIALTATLSILTSKAAPAPVGYVPPRRVSAVTEGIVVQAVGGSGCRHAHA